jgi:hypothetical protein
LYFFEDLSLGGVVADDRAQHGVASGVRECRQHRHLSDVSQPDYRIPHCFLRSLRHDMNASAGSAASVMLRREDEPTAGVRLAMRPTQPNAPRDA